MSEMAMPQARSAIIRAKLARIETLDNERRQLQMELAPLEAEESWAMGYRMPLRGKRLLDAMDRRDDAARETWKMASGWETRTTGAIRSNGQSPGASIRSGQ